MINFGFSPNASRTIDLDKSDFSLRNQLLEEVPSYANCIGCGGCSASCSSRNYTDFNVLKCNMLFRRGKYDELSKELEKCMLCGKCLLVCPQNVNTRAMILTMRTLLKKFNY